MRMKKIFFLFILQLLLLNIIANAQIKYNICFPTSGATICLPLDEGFELTLTVPEAEDPCYHFVQWMDGDTHNPRHVIVSKDSTFTCTYALNEINITTQPFDPNLGTTSGDGTFECGTDVTITASAAEHYHFSHWEKDGVEVSKDSAYTFEISGSHNETVTYIAHFAIDSVYVKITADDDTKGTVSQEHSSLNTAKTNPFTYPWWTESVTLNATATDPCYRFESWSDGSKDNPYVMPRLEQDTVSITANFVPKKDTLTIKYLKYSVDDISVASGNVLSVGNTEAQVEVDCGEDAEITVTANNPCYLFEGWDFNNDNSIDQELDSTQVSVSHTETALASNRTITLKMRKAKFHVKIVFDPEQGSPWWAPGRPGETNDAWIECGFIQLFATPKSCYEFAHWQYGENPRNTGTEWNGIYISSDTTFYAFYKEKKWNITFGPNDTQMGEVRAEYLGSAASSPLPTMHCDSSFTLTPVAYEGYIFKGWQDGSTDSVRNIVVDNNTPTNFTAVFVPKITLTLRAQTDDGTLGGGEITSVAAVSGSIVSESVINPWSWYCTDGAQVTFTAMTTDPCYDFTGWDDGQTETTRTVTITEDATYTAVFTQKQYIVTIHMIDSDDNQEFSLTTETIKCTDTDITLSKHSSECYEFAGWTDGTFPEERTVVNAGCDLELSAYYKRDKSVVSVVSENAYLGSVKIQETGTASAEGYCGDNLILEAKTVARCYKFKEWSDGSTDSIHTITIGKDDAVYTASFEEIKYSLTASVEPVQAGTLTCADTVYYCGDVAKNLSVTPSSDCYKFLGWSDGETSLQHSNITMICDLNLVARFTDEYNITFGPDNPALGTVEGGYEGQTYSSAFPTLHCGDVFTLSAEPTAHSKFVKWSDGDTNPNRTITVKSDTEQNYTAIFAPLFTVRFESDPTGAATGDTDKAEYEYGETATITINTDPCYDFLHWEDGDHSLTKALTVHSDTVLRASFAVKQYTLTVNSANPSWGTVTGGGTYDCGTQVEVTAMPETNYRFRYWQENGSRQNPYTFAINSNTVLTAEFEEDVYTLRVEVEPSGSATVTGAGTYFNGTDVEVKVTTEDCRSIVSWSDISSTSDTRSIHLVSDSTIVVTTDWHYYTCTININPAEAGNAVVEQMRCGAPYTVSAPDVYGWHFTGWDDGTSGQLYIANAQSDTVLTANYERNMYDVTVDCDPTRGSVTGGGVYLYEEIARLEATPDSGYQFVEWSDGYPYAVYELKVMSDTSLTAVFRTIPFTIYVIQDDTVCKNSDYILPSGKPVPYGSGVTLCIDSTDFEYEPGVWCKRIFTITLYPADDTPTPVISILPDARAGMPLSLSAATDAVLSDMRSRFTSNTPAITGYRWEILNPVTGNYEQYYNTACPTSDSLTIRFTVQNKCGIYVSDAVTIKVKQSPIFPDDDCVSVVYMTVDADTTEVAIDTKRMFHLGYMFSGADVAWYKVTDDIDDADKDVVDDEFAATGYVLSLSKYALSEGEYYARISLPDQTEIVSCSDVLRSATIVYNPPVFEDFILMPSILNGGEVVTLLGLNITDEAQIRIYDSTGKKVVDESVSNVTYYDWQVSGAAGVYMLRVETQDRKKTLKFIVK